uniref:Uncharacterized protein n=1 Tax=Oryza sativa subsp. japonica TaxID=39947 RepID=Q5Z9G9_ORYSJ|nr:hypothetical protein [Oryza sativa Japonica Group]
MGDRHPPGRTTMEDTHDIRRSTRSTLTMKRQSTPTRSHNIQAYIRQDKPPNIDIRDTPGSTLSGTFRGWP